MQRFADPAPQSRRRWAMVAMGSLNFVLSMFWRSSIAVISPALTREFGFSNAQLGDLSAVFFYAFAFAQLPLGLCFDRLGCRKTMTFLAVAGVSGALLCALGQTLNHLLLGRVLLGVGMAGNLMVILNLLAAWFPVDRFAFLSGSVVSFGVLGNLLAATPLAALSMTVGWKASFLVIAFVNAVVLAGFLAVIKDRPDGAPQPRVRSESPIRGLLRLFGMYSYWAISFASFVRYGYFAAIQGLWAVPFLISGLGMDEIWAANAILCMGIGYMIALPLSGSVSDRVIRSRKAVVLASLLLFLALCLSITAWGPSAPLWLVLVTFFGLGFSAAPGNILYAHMKELLPESMVARAMTAVNLFTTLGAGMMTHLLGVVIGRDASGLAGPAAFTALWWVGAGALGLASVMYSVVPDSAPFKVRRARSSLQVFSTQREIGPSAGSRPPKP